MFSITFTPLLGCPWKRNVFGRSREKGGGFLEATFHLKGFPRRLLLVSACHQRREGCLSLVLVGLPPAGVLRRLRPSLPLLLRRRLLALAPRLRPLRVTLLLQLHHDLLLAPKLVSLLLTLVPAKSRKHTQTRSIQQRTRPPSCQLSFSSHLVASIDNLLVFSRLRANMGRERERKGE